MFASPTFDPIEPWQPDERPDADENVELPRFQIYVHIVTPLEDWPTVADDEWWRKHGDW
jgi:hypothetical protein